MGDSKLDTPTAAAVDKIARALATLYPRRSRAELMLAASDVVERFAKLDDAPPGFFRLNWDSSTYDGDAVWE